jgi:hypothetical protein
MSGIARDKILSLPGLSLGDSDDLRKILATQVGKGSDSYGAETADDDDLLKQGDLGSLKILLLRSGTSHTRDISISCRLEDRSLKTDWRLSRGTMIL